MMEEITVIIDSTDFPIYEGGIYKGSFKGGVQDRIDGFRTVEQFERVNWLYDHEIKMFYSNGRMNIVKL
jgi:hypothetical protein